MSFFRVAIRYTVAHLFLAAPSALTHLKARSWASAALQPRLMCVHTFGA